MPWLPPTKDWCLQHCVRECKRSNVITSYSIHYTKLYEFIDWVEYEALCLHAMMLTSFPGYILLKPQSLEALQRIRRYRDQTRVPVGFTIDAGAAVHVLYPEKEAGKVRTELIQGQLAELCAGGRVIHDTLGSGPVKLIGHE